MKRNVNGFRITQEGFQLTVKRSFSMPSVAQTQWGCHHGSAVLGLPRDVWASVVLLSVWGAVRFCLEGEGTEWTLGLDFDSHRLEELKQEAPQSLFPHSENCRVALSTRWALPALLGRETVRFHWALLFSLSSLSPSLPSHFLKNSSFRCWQLPFMNRSSCSKRGGHSLCRSPALSPAHEWFSSHSRVPSVY